MRPTERLRRDLTQWSVLLILFLVVPIHQAWGQSGNGGGGNDGKLRMNVVVDAAQYGSADLAVFMVDDQLWWPHIAKDSGARGAAGVYTFHVRAGFSGPLSLYPIEAIDPDDGTVSLAWNIWSDDPVLIDGVTHDAVFPVSGSSGDVQPQSWLVETPPALELTAVTFFGMPADVVKDDGSAYPIPHWQQSDDPDYVPSPVMYVRGDTMTVTVEFQAIPDDGSGTLYVKGDGPGNLDFGPVAVSVSDDTVTITLTSANAFADQVDFFDSLAITWAYGLTSSGPWKEAGTSENQVYVTLGQPQTTVYHTLVHLGCKNADGETTKDGTVDKIWSEFTDIVVRRMDEEQLWYWYNWLEEDPEARNTPDLLLKANGDCEAWAKFFIDMLKVQDISSSLYEVVEKTHPSNYGFLIKEWQFEGSGVSPETQPYVYIGGEDAFDTVPNVSRGKAQGNNDPPGLFYNHYIVKYGYLFYDPSYGTGPFYDEQQWENTSSDGTYYDNADKTFIKKNDPELTEIEFRWKINW